MAGYLASFVRTFKLPWLDVLSEEVSALEERWTKGTLGSYDVMQSLSKDIYSKYINVSRLRAIELKPSVDYPFIDSQHPDIHLIYLVMHWVPTVTRGFLWHLQIINHHEIFPRRSAMYCILEIPLIDLKRNHAPKYIFVSSLKQVEKKNASRTAQESAQFPFKVLRRVQAFILHNTPKLLEKFPEIRQGVRGEGTCTNLSDSFPRHTLRSSSISLTLRFTLFSKLMLLDNWFFIVHFMRRIFSYLLGGNVPDTLPNALWGANGMVRICFITSLCKWL